MSIIAMMDAGVGYQADNPFGHNHPAFEAPIGEISSYYAGEGGINVIRACGALSP
jgi:hypothetical protein